MRSYGSVSKGQLDCAKVIAIDEPQAEKTKKMKNSPPALKTTYIFSLFSIA
jgi:hypothetical protein